MVNIVYALFEIQQNCAFTTVVFFTMVVNFTMNYNACTVRIHHITRGMMAIRIQSRFTTLYNASCQAFPRPACKYSQKFVSLNYEPYSNTRTIV